MTSIPVHETPYLRPRQQSNPWLIRVPVLFFTGGVLLIVALVMMVAVFRLSYQEKITPGISAFGVNLGGMTRNQAMAVLQNQFTYDETTVFTFRDGDRFWQLSAGELGVWFDAEATVNQAYAISHDEDTICDLMDQAFVWFNGESIAPIIRYDQNVALARLTQIATEIDRPPQDASLVIQGTQVVTTPGQAGRVMDIAATLAALDNSIMSLTTGSEIPLTIHEAYPTVWNVDEAANKVQAALSSTLELYADGANGERLGPWTVSVDQIATLLQIQLIDHADGTRSYTVGIDMSVFEGFLAELAPGLIGTPKDGRFHFDNTTGQLVVIQPAVNGRQLNVPETLRALEQAVFRYDTRSVPMAFDYTLPRYHDTVTAAELGITQLVAEATTYYTGSTENRRHNISHGASLFDGVIIGPGEEFSFNFWLGDVSVEAGFLESKVIEGERTVDGIGGGICQVSTTIFRAAFSGGFPIIERNSHAYRVGFYELNAPPGLDAAIWTPDRDFRFQNDTPYHLLIETSVYPANNTIQFRLYSTNPGRVVEIQEPTVRNPEPALAVRYEANSDLLPGQVIQVDWAAEGADVNVKRVIRDLEGNTIKEDNIFTHYLPWGAIYQVSPNDSRLNG